MENMYERGCLEKKNNNMKVRVSVAAKRGDQRGEKGHVQPMHQGNMYGVDGIDVYIYTNQSAHFQ